MSVLARAIACSALGASIVLIAVAYASVDEPKTCDAPFDESTAGMHLAGGGGADHLIFGDEGVELAVYNSPTDSRIGSPDLVEGFQLRQDKIDLRKIGARLKYTASATTNKDGYPNVPSGRYTIIPGRDENESIVLINTGGDEADSEIYVRWHGKPGETLTCLDVLE